MRRRSHGEQVEKLPLDYSDQCPAIRRRCQRWANDNLEALRVAAPRMPESSNDRAVDNWTPLFAIAETVGESWPKDAKAAFQALTPEDDEDAKGLMLLEDIRRVFQEQKTDRLHSADIVEDLKNLEERPWAEWNRGKGLTPNGLARLLKSFQIRSGQICIGGVNRNGYKLSAFKDAFDRYLTPSHPPKTGFQNSTSTDDVGFQNRHEASNYAGCRDVEFQNAKKGVSGKGYGQAQWEDL